MSLRGTDERCDRIDGEILLGDRARHGRLLDSPQCYSDVESVVSLWEQVMRSCLRFVGQESADDKHARCFVHNLVSGLDSVRVPIGVIFIAKVWQCGRPHIARVKSNPMNKQGVFKNYTRPKLDVLLVHEIPGSTRTLDEPTSMDDFPPQARLGRRMWW